MFSNKAKLYAIYKAIYIYIFVISIYIYKQYKCNIYLYKAK